jgi:hypothetical protein
VSSAVLVDCCCYSILCYIYLVCVSHNIEWVAYLSGGTGGGAVG